MTRTAQFKVDINKAMDAAIRRSDMQEVYLRTEEIKHIDYQK